MKKRIKNPDYPTVTPHISGGVLFDDGWLFISGQGPIVMQTKEVAHGSIEEETKRTIENIGALLREAGGDFSDVVKCTCYLSDLADFEGFNKTYQEFFSLDVPPARTTVGAPLLAGIKVEIDAVARIRRS
jgi:2-iminobutanoate/2-iminopropanoate deaminase